MKPPTVRADRQQPALVFPGEIAGASLKRRRHPLHAPAPRPVFPGEIAGASLKPLGAGEGRPRARVFSPAKSPGPH